MIIFILSYFTTRRAIHRRVFFNYLIVVQELLLLRGNLYRQKNLTLLPKELHVEMY